MVARHRSPNYPGVDLEAAIDAVVRLYGKVKRGEFTPGDATEAWGYSSASGPVRVKLGALRQFGMIEGKKGDNPSLSRLGVTFAVRNRASREYQEALRLAALRPTLFAEIQQVKPRATDDALREYLVMDKNFAEEGAARFVEMYRNSLKLAGADDDDIVSGLEEGEPSDPTEVDPMEADRVIPRSALLTREAKTEMLMVPLPGGGSAALPSRMTTVQWEQMNTILSAYKALVVREQSDAKQDDHKGPQEGDK